MNTRDDFDRFDLILVMDHGNRANVEALRPAGDTTEVRLFAEYAGQAGVTEVPDPYYGGDDGFEHVLDLVENASRALLKEVSRAG